MENSVFKESNFSGIGNVSFGLNRIEKLAEDITHLVAKGVNEVALVSDPGVVKAGIVGRVKDVLEKSGFEVMVFTHVGSNPEAKSIDEAASLIRSLGKPCVVGLGGGSAIDVAKLACSVAFGEIQVDDYGLGAHQLPLSQVKKIMIPTTAGSGSEITRTCTFKNRQGRTVWVWDEGLVADLVLLDPTLTAGLSPHLTATTGLDALVHAIEACTSQRSGPYSQCFALRAIELVKEHLLFAIEEPRNMEARGNMMLAANFAGVAIDQSGTGVAHAIGHALGKLANMYHGQAVALGLRAALPWNIEGAPQAYKRVAKALGIGSNVEEVDLAYNELLSKTGIDRYVSTEEISAETLAAEILSKENRPRINNNIRLVNDEAALYLANKVLRANRRTM